MGVAAGVVHHVGGQGSDSPVCGLIALVGIEVAIGL